MNIEEKKKLVRTLQEKLGNNPNIIFTNFRGMKVEQLQKLRKQIKDNGFEFIVVKNTLLKKTFEKAPFANEVIPRLKGMTAVTWSGDDPSSSAKILREYQKENENLEIKFGIIEGKVVDAEEIERIAQLPGKNELRATLLSLFNAPARDFLLLLQAPLVNFLYLLQNYKEKKGKDKEEGKNKNY